MVGVVIVTVSIEQECLTWLAVGVVSYRAGESELLSLAGSSYSGRFPGCWDELRISVH